MLGPGEGFQHLYGHVYAVIDDLSLVRHQHSGPDGQILEFVITEKLPVVPSGRRH
jgi:hypothetical protein